MSFVRIVNNCGRLNKLGKQIIKHKKNVNHIPKNNLDRAFEKQEERIRIFENLINKSHNNWKKNQTSILSYYKEQNTKMIN